MRIHAFRRKEAFTLDLAPRGLTEQLVEFYLLGNTKSIVADVTDDHHIDLLLNVPEAYREYSETNTTIPSAVDPETARQRADEEARRTAELRAATQRQQIEDAREKQRKEAAEFGTLIGSSVQPTTISLTGSTTVSLGEVVAAAHRASALSMEEWNALQDDEREALISNQVGVMEREAENAEEAEMTRIREDAQKQEEAAQEAARVKAEKEKADAAAIEAKKFTLVGADGAEIDLKVMNDTDLRAFANKYNVSLPTKIKGDAIRQVIVDSLAPANTEANDPKAE